MAHVLEPAPDHKALLSKLNPSSDTLFEYLFGEKWSAFFEKANTEYLYWDKFKYLPLPEGTPPEILWSYLKLKRASQLKQLPFKDLNAIRFSYWIPDHLLEKLHHIDQQAGGKLLVEEKMLNEDNKKRYLISSLMEEAIASSQLEGAATTRPRAKDLLRKGVPPKTKAERMIVNNYRTVRHIRDMLDRKLNPQLIREIHELITEGTLEDPKSAGYFRTAADEISIKKQGTTLFVPPDAVEIPSRIKTLCDFANAEHHSPFIHPIVCGIIIHFMLSYIHPFVDGNGRTARALFYWYVLKNNYWLFEYLSISRIILHAPAQYERAFLYTEYDDADLTYFIAFHIRVIEKSIADIEQYLTRKWTEERKSRRMLLDVPFLNERQKSLVAHALDHPDALYSISTHKNTHGIVYQTARTDLLGLVDLKLFQLKKMGKRFLFIPSPEIKPALEQCIKRKVSPSS